MIVRNWTNINKNSFKIYDTGKYTVCTNPNFGKKTQFWQVSAMRTCHTCKCTVLFELST